MRGITLSEDFVKQIVGANSTKKISESTEAPQAEAHVCPLCESHLEEPISEERIQEHVDYFLDVINENFDIVGDDLDEEEVYEDTDELDESGEVGDEEESDDEDIDEGNPYNKEAMKAHKRGRLKPPPTKIHIDGGGTPGVGGGGQKPHVRKG